MPSIPEPAADSTAVDYTIDELIAVCIARQVRDGDLLAQGLATPLVAAAYILAQCTHAPNIFYASAIGQGIAQDWAPLGLVRIEELWLGKALANTSFIALAADWLPTYSPIEFFRPAQVDSQGNFNNIAIGKNYERPRLRLPGVGGIPDVSVQSTHMYLYVPRHSRAVFVKELDYLSGLGHHPDRQRGAGPRYLITDLGQFNWANGLMRLTSYHRGVDIQRIRAKTGFELEIAPDVHETPPPTTEEVRLLREEIDPLGVRRLETLAGTARREHLRDILAQEGAL
ncbi:MAG: ketoacid-CoA transferase [Anaerolineae bacterium]|nr:ketoacid-CoA transferase [Anaerolineae bacterium]